MKNVTRLAAAGLTAVAVAGCGGDDGKRSAPKLEGIIANATARSVPLNTARARVEKLLGQPPVMVYEIDAPPQKVKVGKAPPASVRRLERKFGKAVGGIVRVPARTFECLAYRGEQPKVFAWEFCLYDGRLEYVVTRGPLPL